MSSPHVAGAAALYITNNPGATPAAVRSALVNAGECADGAVHGGNNCSTEWTGDPDADTPPLNEPLLKITTDIAVIGISAPALVIQGNTVEVTVPVKNLGNVDVHDHITVTLTNAPPAGGAPGTVSAPQTIVGGLAAGASTDLVYSWSTSGASSGDHTLLLATTSPMMTATTMPPLPR